jgi:hypothetical protein
MIPGQLFNFTFTDYVEPAAEKSAAFPFSAFLGRAVSMKKDIFSFQMVRVL